MIKGAGLEGIELLGDGQQFVAHGIHPDTQSEYVWIGGDPTTVRYDELPEISEAEAHQLQDAIAVMLLNKFGYTYYSKSITKAEAKRRSRRSNVIKLVTTETASDYPKRDVAWATAALEAECERLADTPSGDRNNQLNKQSRLVCSE